MEASGANHRTVVEIGTRAPPLPLPGSGARPALGANKCDGNVSPLRTFVAPFSCGLPGLNGCVASNASAKMIAACARRETAWARLVRADLPKRKRCSGAPFAELIFHFPGVSA